MCIVVVVSIPYTVAPVCVHHALLCACCVPRVTYASIISEAVVCAGLLDFVAKTSFARRRKAKYE